MDDYRYTWPVHASWKQFIIGVLLGIAAWLMSYAGANWMVAFLPLVLSFGLVSHAPFIMANGEHEPMPPLPPFRLSAWLLDLAKSIAVGLVVLFVAPRACTVIDRASSSISMAPADLGRVALCMCWVVGVITTFRRMGRVAAE